MTHLIRSAITRRSFLVGAAGIAAASARPRAARSSETVKEIALAAKGDKKAAIENYGKALSMTTDPVQKKRINDVLAKLKA